MSRDYKNIKKSTAKKASGLSGALTFLSGLSLGLLVAVLVFFYGNELADRFALQRPVAKQANEQAIIESKTDEKNARSIPDPTFEFYNILPNREVDVSDWVTKTAADGYAKAPEEEGNYILQIGSFKQNKAADQVKARLALLGFQAYIESGVINGEGTFRVRIGPYKNLSKLREARERLLANNLDFIQMRL